MHSSIAKTATWIDVLLCRMYGWQPEPLKPESVVQPLLTGSNYQKPLCMWLQSWMLPSAMRP